MDCENLTVDIIDNPINVDLGQDTFTTNLSSDVLNIKLLEESLRTYNIEEVFQTSVDGFIGSTNAGVLASYFVINEIPVGFINNINKIFTLANIPISGTTLVFLNGLLQAPNGLDYSIVSNTITFVKAPKTNMDLYVSYIQNP